MSVPVTVVGEHTVFVLIHVDQFLTPKTSAVVASVLRCVSIPGEGFNEASKNSSNYHYL